jgi:cation:H+ antiporter
MTLPIAILSFLVAAAVVVRAGTSLAAAGDQIAKRTRLGGLFIGTLLLAFATSLPEIATDVTAAATGAPDLAVADLFGSSMANMAILALIDLRYRGRVWPAVELGHARVAAVAIVLTSLAALGMFTPAGAAIGWVGLTTILIFALYLAAVAWFRREPSIARASVTISTPALQSPTGWTTEVPPPALKATLARFAAAAGVILIAAPVVTISAQRMAEITGIAQTSIGVVLLAITTSLPELAASLAALRIGAYDLAVGNLFGSNAANMSVLLLADAAYLDGPILAAVSPSLSVAAMGAILLTALAVAALIGNTETRIRRFEPDAIVLLIAYVGAVAAVTLSAS